MQHADAPLASDEIRSGRPSSTSSSPGDGRPVGSTLTLGINLFRGGSGRWYNDCIHGVPSNEPCGDCRTMTNSFDPFNVEYADALPGDPTQTPVAEVGGD